MVGPYEAVVSYEEFLNPRVRYFGYRWYYPSRALRWTDKQGESFHHWILELKNGSAKAGRLFVLLLQLLWDQLLDSPDVIVTIPPAHQTNEDTDYPLRRIAKAAAELGCGEDWSELLIRAKGIPKAVIDSSVRNSQIQEKSMALSDRLPRGISSVLLLDDVITSGSSMNGAVQCLLNGLINSSVQITGLAFGHTQRTGSTPFPTKPQIPDPATCNLRDLKGTPQSVFGID